jgi:hypothetical protein
MFNGILFIVWHLLQPLLITLGIKVEKALFDIALQYVEQAQSKSLTNEEKREWVAYELWHHDFGTGNKYADSAINFAIELAVAHLKKHGEQTMQPVASPDQTE